MPKTKKKRKIYFGQEVQDAIVDYNTTDKSSEKNTIYETRIHKAFDKLAENIINTFKFSYFDSPFDDIKHEVVAFMVMNMHKYNHEKGSKAFSYFSVVAKNYLILHNNTNYKRKIKMVDIADVKHSNKHATSMNKNTFLTDFTDELVDYFEIHMASIFKKQIDIDIAYALLEILKRRDEIENFNKKSLYILIKEMTQVNTAKITNVVNVMKKHYKKVFNKFYDVGIVN
jgi:hypothetical protein